jgi:outer membrane protein assembly factor BamB/ABC-type Mn2+/Zn2+ transport system permease subunit
MKPGYAVLAGLLALICSAYADDWPCYRGQNGDGVLTETGIATDWPQTGLKQLWSIPLHDDGKNTHAGASIANGRVYIPSRTGSKDVIYCLDAETGKEIWNYSYESTGKAQTYGTGIRAAPTVFGNFVYTLGCYGQLYCLDATKGTLVWNLDLLKDFDGKVPKFGMAAAPVVMNGLLICEPGGQGTSVVALDPATGKTIWKSGDGAPSYAVPEKITIDGIDQILAYLESGLVGFDLKTGKELWRFDYQEEREKNIPQPIVVGNTIYFSNNTLGFSAIRVGQDGTEWKVERLWSARKEKLHYSSPVAGNGCLYYQNSKRELHCMDMKDGSVLWAARNVGMDFATLIRLDERNLLAALDDGHVVLLDVSPAAYREKARFAAVDKCFLQAAIANGKLYLRDHEKLVCFSLKPAPAEPVAATPGDNDKAGADTSFLASWKDKRLEYYVTWLVALSLSILGVLALTRTELLQAGVTGEAAAFGYGLAMLIDGLTPKHPAFFHSSKMYMWTPVLIAVLAAFAAGLGRKGRLQNMTTWLTAAAMSIGVVVLSRLQVSTIDINAVLWSTEVDGTRTETANMAVAAAVTLLTAIFICRSSSSFIGEGRLRSIFLPLWFAFLLGFGVRSTGALFSASCLVFPPLLAGCVVSKLSARILVAVLVGLASTTAGWMVAPHYLCSYAVPAGCIMAILFLLGAGIRLLAGRRELPQPVREAQGS